MARTADVYTHVDLETAHQNAADLESFFLEACYRPAAVLGPFWVQEKLINCGEGLNLGPLGCWNNGAYVHLKEANLNA